MGRLIAFILTTLLLVGHSLAEDVSGVVSKVHDGDTLKVKLADGRSVSVRLAQIDAPELSQPYGKESRDTLRNVCFGRTASVDVETVDRYGRLVGNVVCNGVDANIHQVSTGMAWVYVAFPHSRHTLEIELASREMRKGLWKDDLPTPPWVYRRVLKQGRVTVKSSL